MAKCNIPRLFTLNELPSFKRFQDENANSVIDGQSTTIMFGRAIQWLSFIEVIWPDFESLTYYSVEVRYIVVNDPDYEEIPDLFYSQVAEVLQFFWRVQLTNLYPNGVWSVEILNDPEMTVEAIITKKLEDK